MVAPMNNIEAALNLLEQAEWQLVLVGKGMAWSRAADEVRAFIERTQLPLPRSPMGKGVRPDDHPLSVAAARTPALQNADVFLMGARFNWIFHFGPPPLRKTSRSSSSTCARGDRLEDPKDLRGALDAAMNFRGP
jgi:2-hydroxyacyl-CoA lyase 1